MQQEFFDTVEVREYMVLKVALSTVMFECYGNTLL